MSQLRVYLLGPPEVRWDQEILTIHRRFPRALLFFLASNHRMVGRQELLPLLWEDIPDSVARLRLRETLNRLRTSLPEAGIVLTQNHLVGLDPLKVHVDQLEFERLVDQAGQIPWKIPSNEPMPGHICHILEEAIGLWRGSRFLAGANLPSTRALDEWLTRTAQLTEHQRGRILERLSDHAFAIGDLDKALSMARLALDTEEFSDSLHERILRLLLLMGRRNDAQEHLRIIKKASQKGPKFGFSPELQDLSRQIQADSIILEADSRRDWHVHPGLHAPFVGQVDALQRLRQTYYSGGGILVLGEPGMGKTRLVNEFVNQVELKPRVLLARCLTSGRKLLYQPIIELCRQEINPEEWGNLRPVWARQFLRIFPDLAEIRPDLKPSKPVPPEQARTHLLEALRQLILLIARSQRVLLFLDNAQWADEATFEAITYLLGRPPFQNQAVLIFAFRSDPKHPGLKELLNLGDTTTHLSVVHLARLSLQEITELTNYVVGRFPGPAFIRQLSKESGGNPHFILEILHSLVEQEPKPDLSVAAPLPLTNRLRKHARSHVQRLSDLGRSFLEVAAIAGNEFVPSVVAQVGPFTELETVQALDELEGCQLVEPLLKQPAPPSYFFIHDVIRKTLLEEISPIRADYYRNKYLSNLSGVG